MLGTTHPRLRSILKPIQPPANNRVVSVVNPPVYATTAESNKKPLLPQNHRGDHELWLKRNRVRVNS